MTRLFAVPVLACALSTASSVAAQAVAPTTSDTFDKILIESYPTDAIREGRSAGALVDLWLDPRGRIYRCDLDAMVGDEALAKEMCRLVLHRTVHPALDHQGVATTGRIRTFIKMMVDGGEQSKAVQETVQQPDFELQVNRLPNEQTTYDVKLVVEANSDGVVSFCSGEAPADPKFAAVACKQVSTFTFSTGRDDKDLPTSYVTELKVRFSSNHSNEANPANRG